MVNRETIKAQRAEREAKKEAIIAKKEKSLRMGTRTFDRETFMQNVETKELEEMVVSKSTLKARTVQSSRNSSCGIRWVYSIKSGKRLEIAQDLHVKLGQPETLQCGFTSTHFLISEKLDEEGTDYPVRGSSKSPVIYSAGIVEDAIINFNLEFSDGRVCMTFNEVEFFVSEKTSKIVAKIKMVDNEMVVDNEGGDLNEA